MSDRRGQVWAGVDAGEGRRWAAVVDETGAILWSKTDNDESAILAALGEILESLPAMGPILGAEFVVAAGGLSAYADSGHLASAAGLVPVPRDSGRRTGNLHRPKRYSCRLRRVFCMSAQTIIIREGPNRDFTRKKRGEGCKHVQAVIALARRRASVVWALLRTDGSSPPPRRSRKRLDFVMETPCVEWRRTGGSRDPTGRVVGRTRIFPH